MGLETFTYITSLNSSNPVGATDPKSQGDDHLRGIKLALLNSFPSIAGAVTLTHAQINDAAQKSVSNVFTNRLQKITATSVTNALWEFDADSSTAYFGVSDAPSSTFVGDAAGNAVIGGATGVALSADNVNVHHKFTWSNSTTTLNGVAVSDFARLSQANTFTGADQTITNAAPTFTLNESDQGANSKNWRFRTVAGTFALSAYDDAFSVAENVFTSTRSGAALTAIDIGSSRTLSQITLAGVQASDFARLSQNNIFSGATQKISITSGTAFLEIKTTDAAGQSQIQLTNSAGGWSAYMAAANSSLRFHDGTADRFVVANGGNFDFKGGTVTSNNASAAEVGTKGYPRRNVSASASTNATDAHGAIVLTGSTAAQTFTLNANPPVDSVLLIVNESSQNWTIAATGTLTKDGGTGSFTLAAGWMLWVFSDGSGNWRSTSAL